MDFLISSLLCVCSHIDFRNVDSRHVVKYIGLEEWLRSVSDISEFISRTLRSVFHTVDVRVAQHVFHILDFHASIIYVL